jgi:hypothetical protein
MINFNKNELDCLKWLVFNEYNSKKDIYSKSLLTVIWDKIITEKENLYPIDINKEIEKARLNLLARV